MGYLMDTIAYKKIKKGKIPETEKFQEELEFLDKKIPWTEGNWTFGKNLKMPWNEIQNTNRHIDLVTNYLLRKYQRASQNPSVL